VTNIYPSIFRGIEGTLLPCTLFIGLEIVLGFANCMRASQKGGRGASILMMFVYIVFLLTIELGRYGLRLYTDVMPIEAISRESERQNP